MIPEKHREKLNNLDELIAELENREKIVKELKTEIVSLDKSVIDSHSMVNSINLRYFAWGLSFNNNSFNRYEN